MKNQALFFDFIKFKPFSMSSDLFGDFRTSAERLFFRKRHHQEKPQAFSGGTEAVDYLTLPNHFFPSGTDHICKASA
ncbi:MAG: hypothetical protein ACLT8E_00375 [Akkermansia sp.]